MKANLSFLLLLSVSFLFSGCAKDNMTTDDTPVPYQKIGEGYAIGAATRVELFTRQGLTTGYNTLYLALYDSVSRQSVENAQITLLPIMNMGSMKHSSPFENPASSAKSRLFEAAAVFTMPSGNTGAWTIDVNVAVAGKQGKLTLPLTVSEPAVSRLKSFVSKADNAKFFLALLQPAPPKVGVNDLEIAIYKATSMMAYPADSSLTVTLAPEMPTMGHGSPNNVDPVHSGSGRYKGKVNFTMTGLWHLHLAFKAGSAVADTATFFEVNF